MIFRCGVSFAHRVTLCHGVHMSLPELLSSPQAAALLGCSSKTVHRLVDDGTLTPYLVGPGGPHGAYMFRRIDVEQVAKDRGQVTDVAS